METKTKSEIPSQIMAYLQLHKQFVTRGYESGDRFNTPDGLEVLKTFINRNCVCVCVKSTKEKYLTTYLEKLKSKVEHKGGVFIAVRTLNEFKEWYQFYSTTGKG